MRDWEFGWSLVELAAAEKLGFDGDGAEIQAAAGLDNFIDHRCGGVFEAEAQSAVAGDSSRFQVQLAFVEHVFGRLLVKVTATGGLADHLAPVVKKSPQIVDVGDIDRLSFREFDLVVGSLGHRRDLDDELAGADFPAGLLAGIVR